LSLHVPFLAAYVDSTETASESTCVKATTNSEIRNVVMLRQRMAKRAASRMMLYVS